MTEKRFRVVNHDEYDYELDYITDNGKQMHIEDVCDLLNEQHENILFKIELIDILQDAIGELKEKNEKKKEHQMVLENKIHRMRKSIHKLEWLAHHRNAELLRENEQLKHDATVLIQANQDYRRENKQLKQQLKTKYIVNNQYEENQRLIKMLDNVANYMQKEHKDMSIDDFVEWWNNIVTEGLEND